MFRQGFMLKRIFWLTERLKLYGPKTFCQFAAGATWHLFSSQLLRNSYSQYGEDLVIDKLLGYKQIGFYADVGAYDPHRFSNTKRFYRRGWRGINIEPNFSAYQKFVKARPRDINLNLGVGEKPGKLTFYKFFPDTRSTFSREEATKNKQRGCKVVSKLKVKIDTLANILSKYAANEVIDFFSIDTEGFDMIVLQSNNWRKFKPPVICIESSGGKKEPQNLKKERYLNNLGYQKFFETELNSIYFALKK